jgi:hypothetical protein
MSAEDYNGGHSPSVNPTKVDHSLDDLAKGLARGTISRREAVRLMGAALLGGALASVPGMALGQSGGNSACAQCCQETFPPGRERGQCVSACAQGEGPCGPCPKLAAAIALVNNQMDPLESLHARRNSPLSKRVHTTVR